MTTRRSRAPGRALLSPILALLLLTFCLGAFAADEDEYQYVARPGDTLIGLSRRLLREPRRWPEVQKRNRIGNEYRIKPGSTILIPYSWLKVTTEAASVTKVAGQVTAAGQPVVAGQSLSQGSVVETGPDGSVAIDLADGSRIILQKSSSLRLSGMQHIDGVPNSHDVQLQLPNGHADTLVKPHRDVGRFEIITPTAALAVRGTVFRASTQAEAVTTETLEGVVAVSASGQTVATQADFGTRVEKGAAPLKPVPLLPAPVLSVAPATNERPQLHLELAAVPGAKSYHLQISDDPQFQTLLADVRSDQSAFELPSPADGTYWLRARAVDPLEIEGHDAVQTFVQRLAPEPPKPPPPTPELVSVSRRELHFKWTAQPNQQYRVQIASDEQFRHVRTDQTVSEGVFTWHRPWPGRYYIRVEPVPADGTAQMTPFDVPVPLWMRIAAPIVILTPLLF